MPDQQSVPGEGDTVRAVDRAVDILEALAAARRPVTVVELGRSTGLSRPTLYRLLATLDARGLVRGDGGTGRFRLGPTVMGLAHAWAAATDVTGLARPLLEALRDETGETAALFLLRDQSRLCVLEAVGRHALVISRGIGETEHISLGASGKAMLAFIPEDDGRLAPMLATVPAGTDPAELRRDLDRARKAGFAVSRGEKFAGAVAIAAPVLDHAGMVVGSVGLLAPEVRMPRDRVAAAAPKVMAVARRISAELGAPDPRG